MLLLNHVESIPISCIFLTSSWGRLQSVPFLIQLFCQEIHRMELRLEQLKRRQANFTGQLWSDETSDLCMYYCWWTKSCTSWYNRYPIIYRVSYIPGGAGFPPSTVEIQWKHGFAWQPGSRYEGNLVFFGLGALLLTHTARIGVCGVSLGISPFAFTCIL